MAVYLPWWIGGAVLAAVTVGCCIIARRPLGVSGIIGRIVNLRAELASDRARSLAAANEAALEAALVAATAEAFGPAAVAAGGGDVAATPADVALPVAIEARDHGCGGDCGAAASRPTVGAHAAFLVAVVAGGFLASLGRGGWAPAAGMGPTFERIVGSGARGAIALVLGGVLVGIGTSVGGGCSTGHGLSGCSRLQPAGLAATASFMATAVAVSFLLAGRGGP